MTTINVGDRVRVTTEKPVHGYQPGSKGTVERESRTCGRGLLPYYLVTMDKDGPIKTSVLFGADDIEPDV